MSSKKELVLKAFKGEQLIVSLVSFGIILQQKKNG